MKTENRTKHSLWVRLCRRLRWILFTEDYCPTCCRHTCWNVMRCNPVHPDGPVLFEHFKCLDCGFETGGFLPAENPQSARQDKMNHPSTKEECEDPVSDLPEYGISWNFGKCDCGFQTREDMQEFIKVRLPEYERVTKPTANEHTIQ